MFQRLGVPDFKSTHVPLLCSLLASYVAVQSTQLVCRFQRGIDCSKVGLRFIRQLHQPVRLYFTVAGITSVPEFRLTQAPLLCSVIASCVPVKSVKVTFSRVALEYFK